ncbi:GbpC/Spa domain-containing protein [uncultured Limosilactobacillus sp.]|uniref:GbpC/Spa domain-containing protein n=1 Tax=uncultured Limosilactobacillus sp. TaxID=2837629 RepID=UPI0025EF9882|nr:GbpC/Spa domain-containing protein [uncultured Limosilactobacillus sp.]
MVSKSNARISLFKQSQRVQRWGIRKLGIGVVSVMLGIILLTAVHTDSVSANSQLATSGEHQPSDQTPAAPTGQLAAHSSAQDSTSDPVAANNDSSTTSQDGSKVGEGTRVTSHDIHQTLVIHDEPDATVKISGSRVGQAPVDDGNHYGVPTKSECWTNVQPGSVIKVTYTGLKHSSYDNRPIKSVVYTFSNFEAWPGSDRPMSLAVFNNVNAGFDIFYVKNVKVAIQLFYDDQQQQPVKFNDQSKGYLVFSSLNNYKDGNGQHIEQVKVDEGKPLTIVGSKVNLQKRWLFASKRRYYLY